MEGRQYQVGGTRTTFNGKFARCCLLVVKHEESFSCLDADVLLLQVRLELRLRSRKSLVLMILLILCL